jgi:tetratricopeptide (TPR) repeat protein
VKGARRFPALAGTLLAATLAAAGDAVESAEAAFQRGDLETASRIARSHLAAQPGDARMTVLQGLVELRRAETMQQAGHPGSEVESQLLQARATLLRAEGLAQGRVLRNLHHAIGLTWMQQRRWPEAIDRFSRALGEEPERADLVRLRASCRAAGGQPEAALDDLSRAVALEPDDLATRTLHAEALYRAGRPADARATWRDFLARIAGEPADDRHFEAHYQVFTYSLLMNEFEPALAALERARELRPDHLTVRSELGALYYRLGRFDEAAAAYTAILESGEPPQSLAFHAHHHLGLVHQHAGRYALAREEFEKALTLSPNSAEVLQPYAAALRRLGEDEAARRVLERFREVVGPENDVRLSRNRLRKNPLDRTARVQLVSLLIDLDRRDEARRELADFREHLPDDPSIPQLEARLREE